jgi:hypothetical protein
MLPSEEYRAAARVLKRHAGIAVEKIAFYEQKAAEAERFENYAADLGRLRWESGEPFDSIGYRIMSKLLDDGWTPPDGLLGLLIDWRDDSER